MIAIAREVEMNIIAHEAKMRNCGEIPPPRSTYTRSYEVHAHINGAGEVVVDAWPKRAMADRLGEKVQLKDRLGSRVVDPSILDSRRCHRCQELGAAPIHEKQIKDLQPRRKSTRWPRTELRMSSARAARRKVTPLLNAGRSIPNKCQSPFKREE